MIQEFIFVIILFGAFPVAYITRGNDDMYKIFGFVIASIIAYGFLGFICQLWPLFILVPAAWYFALKPVFDKRS